MPNSTIKEVAIYRNSCFITRQGTIKLNADKQNVILDYLDGNIDVSTLSLSLPENLKGSNVQLEPFNQEEKENILSEINDRISEVENKISIKQKQIEMWIDNANFSNKDSLSITEISKYIDTLPDKLETIYKEISELEKKKKEIEIEKKDKMAQANSYAIKADIIAEKQGEYPFILKYQDHRANWSPMYEIHTSDNEELSLMLKAKINQYTKEDFENVKLTLFSNNPNLSSDIPELYPINLNYQQVGYGKLMANIAIETGAPRMKNNLEEESVVCGSAYDMKDVIAPVATSNAEETMTRYDIDGLWNIKDNKEITLDLQSNNIPCKYHIVAIPKMDDYGYLAAEVKINDIQEIMNSNAFVYHNNTYVGQIYLNVDPNKDTYDVSLGKDESIRLKRKQIKKYASDVLLKGQKKIDYEYELTVNSNKDKKCQITLLDQVPVSQDKTIVVDLYNASNGKLDETTGQLTWEFELSEKETKTFDLAYAVAYAKDKTINL